MTWVPLDDGFPNHPKAARAGDLAAWLYVCGLCYAGQNLTDGAIPKNQVAKLTGLPNPGRLARKLVEVGLWEDAGSDDYRIHDYDQWNKPAEDVKRKREADRQRKASWRKSGGRDTGPPPDGSDDSGGSPPGIPRSPTPPQSLSSEGSSLDNPRVAEPESAERGSSESQNGRSAAVFGLLAVHDLDAWTAKGGEVKSRRAWLAKAASTRRESHADEVAALFAEHPDWTDAELAAAVIATAKPSTNGRPPDPLEATGAAARALAERNDRRLRGEPLCGKCSDEGLVEREDGDVERCSCATSRASA